MKIEYKGYIYEVSEETSKYYLCDLLANKIFKFIMSFSELLFKSNEVNSSENTVDKEEFKSFFKLDKRKEKQFDYLKTQPFSKYLGQSRDYGTYYYIPLQDIFPKDVVKKLKDIKSNDPFMVNQIPAILKIVGNVRLKLIGGSKNSNGFLCLDAPELPDVKYKCSGAGMDKSNILYIPFLDPNNYSPLPLLRYSSQLSGSLIHEVRHLYDNIIDNMDMNDNVVKWNESYEDYLSKPSEKNAHFETMAKDIEKYIIRRIKDVNKLYNNISTPDPRYALSPKESIKEDPWDYNNYVEQRNYLIDLMASSQGFLSFISEHFDAIFPHKSSSNFYQFASHDPTLYKELTKKITDIFVDLKAKYKNVLPVKKYEKKTSNFYDEELKNGNK